MYLFLERSSRTVRERCNREHHDGWRARVDGMANRCEPLINVVISNKPKMLTGLDQKVVWWVGGLHVPLS
jgi:hypothetical protein